MASTISGIFSKRLTSVDFGGRPCLFLDRDGVQVNETNYLHKVEDVQLIPGVAEAIASANSHGVAVVMVTNQAGIGRGYYSWDDFDAVQKHILEHCAHFGAHYDMTLACAYHVNGIGAFAVDGHPWRKPGAGMLLAAADDLGVDMSLSYIVGDTLSDLVAGAAAGLPGGALVQTGHGLREWQERGEASFAALERAHGFNARLENDAGVAIRNWLARSSPGSSAA